MAEEHQTQCALVSLLRYRMRPELVCFSIPNGGLRNPRVQQQLINEGLLNGMPDLGFAVDEGQMFWLEMKAKKGALSDEQKGIRYKLEHLGHHWEMARSVDEAMDLLTMEGILK